MDAFTGKGSFGGEIKLFGRVILLGRCEKLWKDEWGTPLVSRMREIFAYGSPLSRHVQPLKTERSFLGNGPLVSRSKFDVIFMDWVCKLFLIKNTYREKE